MNVNEMNWRTWLNHGDQYLKAGTPKKKKSVFGNDVVYNILSMSLEGYIMAILDFHHSLPENHTYTDLMDALEKVVQVDPDLKHRVLKYENIQSICSLEKFHIAAPGSEELHELREAIGEISMLAHRSCAA